MAALPILQHREQILKLIKTNQVTALRGDNGCGKSTQLPQFLIELENTKKVLVTQPRRIAAKRVAERVAEEQNCTMGTTVGY